MLGCNRSRHWNAWLSTGVNIVAFAVVLWGCGCSEKERDEPTATDAVTVKNSTSAKIVDFDGYPFAPGWVLKLAEKDRLWATYLVDRALTAYATGQLETEILYLHSILESLEVVQIKGSFEDYREPLFITSDYQTNLARRLRDAGLDVGPARFTPWHYKDGFIRGVIAVLEYANDNQG